MTKVPTLSFSSTVGLYELQSVNLGALLLMSLTSNTTNPRLALLVVVMTTVVMTTSWLALLVVPPQQRPLSVAVTLSGYETRDLSRGRVVRERYESRRARGVTSKRTGTRRRRRLRELEHDEENVCDEEQGLNWTELNWAELKRRTEARRRVEKIDVTYLEVRRASQCRTQRQYWTVHRPDVHLHRHTHTYMMVAVVRCFVLLLISLKSPIWLICLKITKYK